jgi:hypothetical protein
MGRHLDDPIRVIGRILRGRSTQMTTDAAPIGATRTESFQITSRLYLWEFSV